MLGSDPNIASILWCSFCVIKNRAFRRKRGGVAPYRRERGRRDGSHRLQTACLRNTGDRAVRRGAPGRGPFGRPRRSVQSANFFYLTVFAMYCQSRIVICYDSPMGNKLGQHFLTSEKAVKDMVVAGEVSPKDTVLEIGPGKGVLTRALLNSGARVVALEKDSELVEFLKSEFVSEIGSGQLELIETDVRDFVPTRSTIGSDSYKLIANIPYYITGEIIRTYLTTTFQPETLVLLVQKEVARRIVARDKKESILSISVKAYGHPSVVSVVKAGSFNPKPKVDSAILKIENVHRDFFSDLTEQRFFEVLKNGFSEKRKQLAGLLGIEKEKAHDILRELNLSETIRAEDLTLENWKDLVSKF